MKISVMLVSLALAAPATAGEPVAVLPEIVASASRWEEPLERVPQDMTVIAWEEIEQKGVPFVVDLLRLQPDLQVVQNGGAGTLASVLLRGGGSSQVLVMIDGIKLNSPSTGSADLSGLLTTDVERIEIIKGPQSTLYGSEAMAGVVNILTRKGGEKLQADLSAEGGSYRTVKTAGTVSGGGERADYRLSATWLDTEGFPIAREGSMPNGASASALSARLGAKPSDDSSLELNLRYGRERTHLDDFAYGVGPVDTANYLQTCDSALVALSGSVSPVERYEQRLTLSFLRDDLEATDPVTAYNNYRIVNTTESLDWQHTLELERVTLAGGFAYRYEGADNEGSYARSSDTRAGYLDAKLTLPGDVAILSAGLRGDDHSAFGTAVTWRAGLLARIEQLATRFKANAGTGFRAPSLNELYYPNYGNPALEPEESFGYDIGLESDLAGGLLTAGATWFRQEYRNLIQTNFSSYRADNIGRARSQGLEVRLLLRPMDALKLQAAYTWLDAVNEETGARLPSRPRSRFVASLDYRIGAFSALAEYLYVSERYDAGLNRTMASYGLVNLKGEYRFSPQVALFARMENLGDESYEEAAGYGTAGLSVYGGVALRY